MSSSPARRASTWRCNLLAVRVRAGAVASAMPIEIKPTPLP
jgi:hypothetical protein